MAVFITLYRDFQRWEVQVDTVISDSKLRFHRKMTKRSTDRSDKFLFFRILNDVDVQVPIRGERFDKVFIAQLFAFRHQDFATSFRNVRLLTFSITSK